MLVCLQSVKKITIQLSSLFKNTMDSSDTYETLWMLRYSSASHWSNVYDFTHIYFSFLHVQIAYYLNCFGSPVLIMSVIFFFNLSVDVTADLLQMSFVNLRKLLSNVRTCIKFQSELFIFIYFFNLYLIFYCFFISIFL